MEVSSTRPMRPLRIVASAWGLLLDIVYPPRCGGCDRRGVLFCDRCLLTVSPPQYDPSHVDNLNLLVCAGVFAGPLRAAIHKLKYESDAPLARPLARLLSDALASDDYAELDGEPPVLVPVPLHKARRKSRGYNQAELLARELARITGWPLEAGLVRVKDTRSQVGLSADERRDNVTDAFVWQGKSVPERVLLVDDVCTTGSTLSECAVALQLEGVQKVYAITVAKAVGGGPEAGS